MGVSFLDSAASITYTDFMAAFLIAMLCIIFPPVGVPLAIWYTR